MKRKTTEEYIETIYVLEKRDGYAKTSEISLKMGIRPPSVTEILQKLQKEGCVKYKPYKGVKLTNSGKKIARKLMKTHKVIADFLEIIGIERELAEVDACQIEHQVSPKTMARLRKFVEFIINAPRKPKWIEHFHHYIKTGERKKCNYYDNKE
ncbi:MAG: metal-dependent transcriptional regulator [Candidatus Thermoplasmatota archaeon]|nr:metal-dependent transcriptional regulator [Candidatus Thermoplasmatota archaeon]